MLALYAELPGSVPGTEYDPQVLPGIILEYKVMIISLKPLRVSPIATPKTYKLSPPKNLSKII